MRCEVPDPSIELSHRVFQYISLPLKKARLTPAARAASTFTRCCPDQYLVVADRQERLVAEDERSASIRIDARGVAHVEAVGLEEPDHRVLGVEDPVLPVGHRAGDERTVVADLVGAAGIAAGAALIEAVAAVVVVGLPRRVGGLEQQVGLVRRVVGFTHDEEHVARPAGVDAAQLGEVDARHRIGRHGPLRRHAPVAAVDEAGAVGQAVRLHLRQCRARLDAGGVADLARAHPAVKAHAIDVETIVRRRRVDLELDHLAGRDADVGREALDRGVAGSADVPFAGQVARLGVLARNRVDGRAATALRMHGDTGTLSGGEEGQRRGNGKKAYESQRESSRHAEHLEIDERDEW